MPAKQTVSPARHAATPWRATDAASITITDGRCSPRGERCIIGASTSLRSAGQMMASEPRSPRISCAACSSVSRWRPTRIGRYPSAASALAISLPIPDEAPVISACFLRPLGVSTADPPLQFASGYICRPGGELTCRNPAAGGDVYVLRRERFSPMRVDLQPPDARMPDAKAPVFHRVYFQAIRAAPEQVGDHLLATASLHPRPGRSRRPWGNVRE